LASTCCNATGATWQLPGAKSTMIRDGVITLAAKGKLLADRIAADLFIC
jgi:hypothetical protein